jgi:hypothetical protein
LKSFEIEDSRRQLVQLIVSQRLTAISNNLEVSNNSKLILISWRMKKFPCVAGEYFGLLTKCKVAMAISQDGAAPASISGWYELRERQKGFLISFISHRPQLSNN